MTGDAHQPRGSRLAIETRLEGARAIVAIGGELDVAALPALQEALAAQERAGRDVELDLAALTYIDSSGLTLFFQTAQRARRAGWELRVVNVRPAVLQMLELTGLDLVLGLDQNDGA
jgi:anti-sigma B factor antagonist